MANLLHLGRALFWPLVLGFLLAVLLTYDRLPPVVASHFDGAGAPNGWSSRAGYAALLVVIGAGLPAGIVALVTLLTRRGPERLNIPARQYWVHPERGAEAVRRVRAYMWWLGCIMTGASLVIHLLVVEANASDPPRLGTRGILLTLVATLGGIGLWIAGWYRLLRPPAGG